MSDKDDYISRRDAIKAIEKAKTAKAPDGEIYVAKINAEMNIQLLPSVQPEIINCFECVYYKPISSSWGKCYVHSSRTERYRTCQFCDYCSWAERKTE